MTRAAKSQGIDCARPLTAANARLLAASGMAFAARYLVPERLAWKRLTRAEADALTGAGLQIVSVFETTANRPSGGAAAGEQDGAEALREAKLIGQSEGSAIYFAVDYNAGSADFDAIASYLLAAAKQVPGYRAGVYGSYAVIEAMAERRACAHFWQTYAWSGGLKSSHANIYQYRNGATLAGVELDLNESYGGEGWWNTKPQPSSPSSPEPKEEEEESYMLAQKDAEAVIRLLASSYELTADKEARAEIHRLADEIRKAAALPVG